MLKYVLYRSCLFCCFCTQNLFFFFFLVAFAVTGYKSKELTRKQSQQLELLEYEIRKEIREGRSKELSRAQVQYDF